MKNLLRTLIPLDGAERFMSDEENFRKSNPEAWENFWHLRRLYESVAGRPKVAIHETIGAWLKRTTGPLGDNLSIYREFQSAIQEAKIFRSGLVRENIPDALRFSFTSEGVTSPTSDPWELLKIIWEPAVSKRLRPLRVFEANLFWSLGMRYLIMKILNAPIESQLRELTLLLEDVLFFEDGQERASAEALSFSYDPARLNRMSGEDGGHKVSLLVNTRIIKTDDGKLIRVMYENRVKGWPDIFRKVLLKGCAENPVVMDGCAFSLIFFSGEDLEEGLRVLRERVFTNTAAIHDSKEDNNWSSGLSLPKKKFYAIVNGGRAEVQIHLFPDWFNRKFSFGEENHNLYRLRQIKALLKVLFPKELYLPREGVFSDWETPEMEKLLFAMQKKRIEASFALVCE